MTIRQIKSFSKAIQRIEGFMNSFEFKTLIQQEKKQRKQLLTLFNNHIIQLNQNNQLTNRKLISRNNYLKKYHPYLTKLEIIIIIY